MNQDDRLMKLEETHAFTDRRLDELQEQLAALNRAVDVLMRRLAAMESRLNHDEAVRERLAGEAPEEPGDQG